MTSYVFWGLSYDIICLLGGCHMTSYVGHAWGTKWHMTTYVWPWLDHKMTCDDIWVHPWSWLGHKMTCDDIWVAMAGPQNDI